MHKCLRSARGWGAQRHGWRSLERRRASDGGGEVEEEEETEEDKRRRGSDTGAGVEIEEGATRLTE